jgi:hypothetical protein
VRLQTLAIGALVGYAASRTMDVATTAFQARQSAASRQREQELAPGGVLLQLGRQLGAAVGRDLDDETAGRVGATVHRSFGVSYGILAAALVSRGWSPWTAGSVLGAAAFLVVDEGSALPRLTDYPLASHLRGVVGHVTLGFTTAALLALVTRRSSLR